jgi:hypothetical protein
MLETWKVLHEQGADLVINGHDHDYERFAPQNPYGLADANGIREFVVGTGGADQRGFATVRPNSEVGDSKTFGVLKLTLRAGGYDWQFVPVAGATFTDSGSASCFMGHNPTATPICYGDAAAVRPVSIHLWTGRRCVRQPGQPRLFISDQQRA